jgi:hypothetical protein
MKNPQASLERKMPTNDWDRHRPYPTPSDSTCVPSAASAKLTAQHMRLCVGLNSTGSA